MGQYPDFYRAAAIRNPVIEISSMSLLSDIPDWSYFESGLEYNQGKIPTEADFSTMLGKSPIVNVGKIKNPILIFVGEKDARVPPSQGKAFYRVLKGNGKTVKLISYPEGSHPLKNVKVQGDFFMNTVKWFFGYYKHWYEHLITNIMTNDLSFSRYVLVFLEAHSNLLYFCFVFVQFLTKLF